MEIRRFVNQDVVMGTITASQSLNRYSYVQGNPVSYTDPFGLSPEDAEQQEAQEAAEHWGWHAFLDVLGMVPVVGVLASVANGLLYLSEGNAFMAVGEFCFAAADLILPVASALKLTGKAAKAARLTAGTLRTAGYAIGSYTQLREAMQATAEFVLARDDGRFATDKFLTAASSYLFAGMGIGKAARSAGDAFRAGKGLFGEAFSGAAKRISSFASDNRGFVDLDALTGKSSAGKENKISTKNIFPENPDDLLPEIIRDKVTKSNGTVSQIIYPSDNIRIRAEQHPLLLGEIYDPRHHGVHYHVEYRIDPLKSWNNKNNVNKLHPKGYIPGSGTGFIPGEEFPE